MIEEIIDHMGVQGDRKAEKIRTAHRLRLISFWKIEAGSKVLEIGCKGGGTTAALAYIVGGDGYVHGIDSNSYAEASLKLLNSPLGRHIKIDYEADILSDDIYFSPDYFDYIIFSHCSWHFESMEALVRAMVKIKGWGKKLCVSEWDMRVNLVEQLAHYNSVLIRAQCECFQQNKSSSDVRTLFTPFDLKNAAIEAGWNVTGETSIYSGNLQDGKEDVQLTLKNHPAIIKDTPDLPANFKALLHSQLELLHAMTKHQPLKSLNEYAFNADKNFDTMA